MFEVVYDCSRSSVSQNNHQHIICTYSPSTAVKAVISGYNSKVWVALIIVSIRVEKITSQEGEIMHVWSRIIRRYMRINTNVMHLGEMIQGIENLTVWHH